MRIDSHMHVWSFEGVEYYDNKPLFTYMEELKLDRTALIAINNDESLWSNTQISFSGSHTWTEKIRKNRFGSLNAVLKPDTIRV